MDDLPVARAAIRTRSRRSACRARSGRRSRPRRCTGRPGCTQVPLLPEVTSNSAAGVGVRVRAVVDRAAVDRVDAADQRRRDAGAAEHQQAERRATSSGRTRPRRCWDRRPPRRRPRCAARSRCRAASSAWRTTVLQPLPAPLHTVSVQPRALVDGAQRRAADRGDVRRRRRELDAEAAVARARGDRDAGVVVARLVRSSSPTRRRRSCC